MPGAGETEKLDLVSEFGKIGVAKYGGFPTYRKDTSGLGGSVEGRKSCGLSSSQEELDSGTFHFRRSILSTIFYSYLQLLL